MADPVQRSTAYSVGPSFSKSDDGTEMFSFQNDGGSIVGPRPATDKDREDHADAYEAFKKAPKDGAATNSAASAELAQVKADLETRTSDLDRVKAELDGTKAELVEVTKQRDDLLVRASAEAAGQTDASRADRQDAAAKTVGGKDKAVKA